MEHRLLSTALGLGLAGPATPAAGPADQLKPAADDVTGRVIIGSGHRLLDAAPKDVKSLLTSFVR